MKRRLAGQSQSNETIGSIAKGLSSDLEPADHRERVLKVAAPQGKVCTGGTGKAPQGFLGYPCDYLAPEHRMFH